MGRVCQTPATEGEEEALLVEIDAVAIID